MKSGKAGKEKNKPYYGEATEFLSNLNGSLFV
jgi:hypothetical protein